MAELDGLSAAELDSVTGEVTVTNVAARTVQVRDLDDGNGDLVSGRPSLDPGEPIEHRGVAGRTYVAQAWDADGDSPLAPPIRVGGGGA